MSNQRNLEKFEKHLIRARVSKSTIEGYLTAARKYIAFCRGRSFENPQEAVASFLSTYSSADLSVSYQRQALNALAGKNGLYAACGVTLGRLPSWVKPKKPTRVPDWVTQSEVERICEHLPSDWALMAKLMFGSGLRVKEVTGLRWRDLDFERLTITVKQSKGNKDRITFLPGTLIDELRLRYKKCRGLWRDDRERGRPGVEIPRPIANKSPKAGEDWPFFWLFPAAGESVCPETKIRRRHHLHQKSLPKPLRIAVRRAGISKRVTAHAFRHGFATAYLLNGGNIRELMDLMGHEDISTTERYLHCLPSFTDRVGSPLDRVNVVPFHQSQSDQSQSGESQTGKGGFNQGDRVRIKF